MCSRFLTMMDELVSQWRQRAFRRETTKMRGDSKAVGCESDNRESGSAWREPAKKSSAIVPSSVFDGTPAGFGLSPMALWVAVD